MTTFEIDWNNDILGKENECLSIPICININDEEVERSKNLDRYSSIGAIRNEHRQREGGFLWRTPHSAISFSSVAACSGSKQGHAPFWLHDQTRSCPIDYLVSLIWGWYARHPTCGKARMLFASCFLLKARMFIAFHERRLGRRSDPAGATQPLLLKKNHPWCLTEHHFLTVTYVVDALWPINERTPFSPTGATSPSVCAVCPVGSFSNATGTSVFSSSKRLN